MHASDVAGVEQGRVVLARARLDLTDVVRREGEVHLVNDVLDHQLVDVHGVRVVRAADLYLANPAGSVWQLVGVDVAWSTVLRRALFGTSGRRPSPTQVLDWANVQAFGISGGPVTVAPVTVGSSTHVGRLLRPAELADLLEDLGRVERRELLGSLDTPTAADALEEMDLEERLGLLRDADTTQAAELLAEMEPDDAAESLRDLDDDERDELLAAMETDAATRLRTLAEYDEKTAAGLMTTALVTVPITATVADAVAALSGINRSDSHTGVVVLDEAGAVVDDVTALELLGVAPSVAITELTGPPWPVTVLADAHLAEIVETITDNRGISILVVDDANRPLGRVLADDVIDALVNDDEPARWQRRIGRLS